jgi:urea transport system ATP-binding protein
MTGEVCFDGRTDLTKLDEAAIANLGIGRKFQKPTVFESHTIWDNLEMALKKPRGIFPALFYGQRRGCRPHHRNPRNCAPCLHRKDELAADLSHGQKQWLEIGMLLAQDPKLLLVDEPVAGMTDSETEETAKLLRKIAQDPLGRRGRTRHELRARARLARHLSRRGLGAGRGIARPGQRQSVVIERYLGR